MSTEKGQKTARTEWAGELATLCVNNGLRHQEARQEGNEMIAPNHPFVSFSPSLVLLAPFVGHPSDCISSGHFYLIPVRPLLPPCSSWDLLLSSWRRSLICYVQKRERGWEDREDENHIWNGSVWRIKDKEEKETLRDAEIYIPTGCSVKTIWIYIKK